MEKELIPCRIGTADLVHEFMEVFFDNEDCLCNNHTFVGFVDGKPVALHYVSHKVYVDFGPEKVLVTIRRRAQEHFDMCDNDPDSRQDGWRRIALIGKESINLYYQEQ